MISFKEIKDSFLHLFFPHVCGGCGSDILSKESVLCMRCLDAMPETNFEIHPNNPVEKNFWGQIANCRCYCSILFYQRITDAAPDAPV